MSRSEFIVVNDTGAFLNHNREWTSEYPDARIFPNLQAAKRVRDTLPEVTVIYSTEAYANGQAPIVEAA